MKTHNPFYIIVISTFVAIVSFFTGCAKDSHQDNSICQADKSLYSNTIPLNKDEIDILSREIGIAHNCVLFALYQNPIIEEMDAASLCSYIHEFIVENGDSMRLNVLPNYLSKVISDDLSIEINEIYTQIADSIENNDTSLSFPENVDNNLITESIQQYNVFVSETFLNSNSYDEFETACMEHLDELCESTSTTEDYFFMRAGGNITFSSYCAWVTIHSGCFNYNKNFFDDATNFLSNKFKNIKQSVIDNFVKPIAEIVSADFRGGAIGGSATLIPGCMVASSNIPAGVGIIVGGWAVGAATGSIIYANNH